MHSRCRLSLVALTLLAWSAATADCSPGGVATVGPEVALQRLVEGNARFVAGKATHPAQSGDRRIETAKGQHPFAVILTCADSRVPTEILFDQGIGDLFVVRNAGNLLGDHVIGSIEYAVEHLYTPVVVVLGHSKCGAVAAAVAGGEAPGHIKSIVASLAPAVGMARKKPGDTADNATRINAKLSAAALSQSDPILAEWVKKGKVKILAARYIIESGQVEFFP